jgi:hypothetical protein
MVTHSNTEPERRSWLRRLLNRMEVDRAVFYALTARLWQFAAGPVTTLLIVFYFTKEVQGFFYTFGSLLALQAFMELGLQLVIVYVASHEWAGLEIDAHGYVVGDKHSIARLASLVRRVTKWYAAMSLLLVIGVGMAGIVFFSQHPSDVPWLFPWIALVLLTALSLWLSPFIALLEGCNQIAVVNFYRTVQAVAANAAVWICIPLGAGLWASVATALVKLFWECYLVGIRYRRFWIRLTEATTEAEIAWSTEIWPLQWRQAIQSVFAYFSFHLITPVVFYYHGAAVGGRMGMTWTIVTSLSVAAFAWVKTRTPLFGMLIARQDYRELDRVFTRLALISFTVLTIASAAFCGFIVLINSLGHELAVKVSSRLLPTAPTVVLMLAVTLQLIPRCQNIYVRAHKRDPFLLLSCVTNISAGLLIWLLGKHDGPLGAAIGFLAVVIFIQLPGSTWIWLRSRAEWHVTHDAACSEHA